MNMIQQFRLGLHLTKLINAVERAEIIRREGRDLTRIEALELDHRAKEGLIALSRYPRHVITREMLKNAKLADGMANFRRHDVILKLLPILIAEGVALGLPEFEASYL